MLFHELIEPYTDDPVHRLQAQLYFICPAGVVNGMHSAIPRNISLSPSTPLSSTSTNPPRGGLISIIIISNRAALHQMAINRLKNDAAARCCWCCHRHSTCRRHSSPELDCYCCHWWVRSVRLSLLLNRFIDL